MNGNQNRVVMSLHVVHLIRQTAHLACETKVSRLTCIAWTSTSMQGRVVLKLPEDRPMLSLGL
jgi:hypothetical protein